jgi:hypothetical protein
VHVSEDLLDILEAMNHIYTFWPPETLCMRCTIYDDLSSCVQAEPASPTPDIDSSDLGDCHECAEYAADIYTFYRRLEPLIRVPPEYMNQQVRC